MSGQSARCWTVAALLALSPIFTLAVAQSSAPAAQGSAPAAAFSVNAATLRRYVGHYRIGDVDLEAVMTVTLSGAQLMAQVSGQQAVALYAQSATHFVLDQKAPEGSVDFVTGGQGPARALSLHLNGQNVIMPRMDDALATQFNAKLAARVQANAPQPGSQAAISDWLGRVEQGQPPDYSKMAPKVAEAARARVEQTAATIRSLGALQSLAFLRVAPNGADIYRAKFANGSMLVLIVVDEQGIITYMLMQSAS
jgi:hypothetical protein